MSPSAAARKGAVSSPELERARYELGCGATLLVSRRPGAPVTAIRAHVRGGPSLDPEGKEGLAYLTGSLADQGTRRFSETELAERLEPIGGHVHGDSSGLGGTVAGRSWKQLVELLCEVLVHPTFPKAPFERQRARLATRLTAERSEPRVQAAQRFRRLVYGKQSWLGRPAYGNLESMAGIRPADLRRHHRRNWVGSRLVIGVCGDVDPAAVRREFERHLKELDPGKPLEPRTIQLPERELRFDAHSAKREQVHLYVGHLGIRRSDPDYEALVVMDHVLGTGPGFTNRISRKLRDELGLAYTVHAEIASSAGLVPGTFTAYIGTSARHVGTALEGFLVEMRRIQEEPVSEAELETAKGYLQGSFALGFERASRRASFLISSEVHGFPEDHLERMPRALAAVTAEDVQRVAAAHLHPESCCITAGGPLKRKDLQELYGSIAAGAAR